MKQFFYKSFLHHSTSLILIGTTWIAFFYFLLGVNSWKFAYVGDEWSFYRFAVDLGKKNLQADPFSFAGVFKQHAILSSDYQTLFLKLFGYSNFAWRLSNIILIFPLSLFFYLWVKNLFNREVAVISTLILQCSFYLANFFKIGYNNPQSLTLFVISLYVAAAYSNKPTKTLGFLLGILLGVSFYIYLGPLFPLLLWPYFFSLFKQKVKKKVIVSLVLLIGVYLLLLFPLRFAPRSISGPVNAMGLPPTLTVLQVEKSIYNKALLFYISNDDFYLHFVTGPYLDTITGILCFIGTVLCILRFKQEKYRLLLLLYLSIVVVIGITSPYPTSPTTRGIFFLPFGFLFAGIGLYFLIKKITYTRNFSFSLVIFIVTIFSVNLYQSQYGVFHDKVGGYTAMALLIRSFQEAHLAKRNHLDILLSPSLYINSYTFDLPTMLQAYNLQNVTYTIIQPQKIDCSAKIKKHFLLLSYDHDAKDRLNKLRCNQIQYTVLYPQVQWF